MQFEHPHGFRHQVRELLLAQWPHAWRTWSELGAVPIEMSLPGMASPIVGVRSRRSTYERALRRAAAKVDGLRVAVGRVDRLLEHRGRVSGVVVNGRAVDADVVIDASGRSPRLRASNVVDRGRETGMAYVTRNFRRHGGAEPGPMTSPVAWTGIFDRYQVYVFPHEGAHFSAVIIRPTADADFSAVRHPHAFDAACRAIPGLAQWTDPALATPTSGVLVGGRLYNVYRAQAQLPGLVAVGDSVATTAPTAGRGLAMASMQIEAFLDLLDRGADPTTIAVPFGAWCDEHIRPWVDDHIAIDGEAVRSWQGIDIDLTQPLTSNAIVAAAQADPGIAPHIGGYVTMADLPKSLAPAEPLALAVYESDWRAPLSTGPTRDQLLALIEAAVDPADTASTS